MQKFDIAICGAGPVGQSLALLLSKRGIPPSQIVLIDAKTKEQAAQDQRTIALSYGSQQILEAASAWPVKATEIHQIHVSRRGHFGRTLIDREQQRVPALGYVARYGDILQSLDSAFQKMAPDFNFLRPVKINSITQNETCAQINLDNQTMIEANIVVQAEGGFFNEQAPLNTYQDYQQTALVAHVKASSPIAHRAYERFTDQGPLALLPQDDGYALVWCVRSDKAEKLLSLDDKKFLDKLQTAFGERLGQFISTTKRFSFQLGLNAQTNSPIGRCICIGNAAQTLHPVAGQGLNLGLRDAFQLEQFISKSIEPASLQDFFHARKADRNLTIQLTDQLATLFASSTEGSVKQTILGASLGLMDVCAPAQTLLAEHMIFGRR